MLLLLKLTLCGLWGLFSDFPKYMIFFYFNRVAFLLASVELQLIGTELLWFLC